MNAPHPPRTVREMLSRAYRVHINDVLVDTDPRLISYDVIVYDEENARTELRRSHDNCLTYDKLITKLVEINRAIRQRYMMSDSYASAYYLWNLEKSYENHTMIWSVIYTIDLRKNRDQLTRCHEVLTLAREAGLRVCVAYSSERQTRIAAARAEQECVNAQKRLNHELTTIVLKSRKLIEDEQRDFINQIVDAIKETRTFDHMTSEQMISDALAQKILTREQCIKITDPIPGWLYRFETVNVLVTAVYADKHRAAVVSVRKGEREGERWFVDVDKLSPVALAAGSCGPWLRR